jgi:hypothetical protein
MYLDSAFRLRLSSWILQTQKANLNEQGDGRKDEYIYIQALTRSLRLTRNKPRLNVYSPQTKSVWWYKGWTLTREQGNNWIDANCFKSVGVKKQVGQYQPWSCWTLVDGLGMKWSKRRSKEWVESKKGKINWGWVAWTRERHPCLARIPVSWTEYNETGIGMNLDECSNLKLASIHSMGFKRW